MTITLHGIKPATRGGRNSKGQRTYVRVYILSSTDISENEYDVGSHPSLPYIGEVHDVDTGAYCYDIDVKQVAGYVGWEVTVSWSTEWVLDQDPTLDAAVIEWDSEQFQKPAVFDRDGKAILNSAGDFFDPPVMMDDSRRIVTIQKNLASVPAWILSYKDAINIAGFTVDGLTVAAETAKVQAVRVGGNNYRNGTTFRSLTLTLCIDEDGWDLSPLDQGFRKIGYGGELENIRNPGDNERPSSPVCLDGSGGELANPSPLNAVFIPANVYKLKDFTVLPLT